RKCVRGVLLPLWPPAEITRITVADQVGRAIVYLVALIYLFLGVSIVADRFMASIEVITSKEKIVVYRRSDGEEATTTVRIWNETVSNLTLMALGSSAPEIMLSVIEIIGKKFRAGDLGPSTIVGSASFNLFIIIAICMYVIPDGETRKVKHPRVFFITATWSILAYVWMYIILAVSSYGVVEIWEGVLTFLFFPMLVVLAWIADRRLLVYKYMYKRYRARRQNIIVETEGSALDEDENHDGATMLNMVNLEDGTNGLQADPQVYATDPLIGDPESSRKAMVRIMRELRKTHPDADMAELARLASVEALSNQPKSRAFYRIQATRKMTGAGNILNKGKPDQAKTSDNLSMVLEDPDDAVAKIYFDPAEYKVMENCGVAQLQVFTGLGRLTTVNGPYMFQYTGLKYEYFILLSWGYLLQVVRTGGDLNTTLYVDYQTEDGTANAGSDFVHAEDTLVFKPGETTRTIDIVIMDDDIFEEDEYFRVKLCNVRSGDADGMFDTKGNSMQVARLEPPAVATVVILDDDHAGVFSFPEPSITVSEGVGVLKIEVQRNSGARGRIIVPYKTVNGTAKGGGEDFIDTIGELEFDNDETTTNSYKRLCAQVHFPSALFLRENVRIYFNNVPMTHTYLTRLYAPDRRKHISVPIVDDEEYEKNKSFFVELSQPKFYSDKDSGLTVTVDIRASEENEKPQRLLRQLPCVLGVLVVAEKKTDEQEEEARRIAELGKPRLGAQTSIEVMIEESYEFKNTVDKLIKKANLAVIVGTSSWREQFTEALSVNGGDESGEEEESEPSCFDYVMHFLTVFWKLMFAFVPPTEYLGGWGCFTVSILMIGFLTAIIGDVASAFGCVVNLNDAVTAVTLVAMGTSVPDTFASKVAAVGDQYADASIGNVTGSNAVNVFLGIGIAWTIAAIYWAVTGKTPEEQKFRIDPGNLAFSVTIFSILAVFAIGILMFRRKCKSIQAELGGPRTSKIVCSLMFVMFWLVYILLAALDSYCIIKTF
uniref:Calx-beta domain-containing protein n=2 Tax=Ciona savignyi TaxID=51511 RepID=H2YTI9_CIOSA